MADLLSHSELDPDSDGSFTEAEAQVNMLFLYQQYHVKHLLECSYHEMQELKNIRRFKYVNKSKCNFRRLFIQGLLGGVDKVDTDAFETVWNNIKEKYILQVKS